MGKVKIDKKEYDLSIKAERHEYWKLYAQKKLIGKVVKAYSYLRKEELDELGWYSDCTLCIEFTDGTTIFPSADDEGNDGGFFRIDSNKGGDVSLKGMKITSVRYLNEKEIKESGFCGSSVVIFLTDGKWIVSIVTQSDAEGNNAGAIFGDDKKESFTLPVLNV